MSKWQQSVDDCTAALNLDDGYLKALLRRAKSLIELESYEEAVRDCEKAVRLDRSVETKRLLQQAKLELQKSKRKDYYKILGVSKNATDDEIKKAYRKRAMIHHPGKWYCTFWPFPKNGMIRREREWKRFFFKKLVEIKPNKKSALKCNNIFSCPNHLLYWFISLVTQIMWSTCIQGI